MAGLNETPNANRVHIAFFGLRNAGKSTLVNAFTGQPLAIVSDVAGTTTDPVSKAMEILPLGPCLITDTAGLDDEGELGQLRVQKSWGVLATTDVAIWVASPHDEAVFARFETSCRARGVTVLTYRRGDSVEALKRQVAALRLNAAEPDVLEGVLHVDESVVCVCPIDESAPKGRLILPQVQVIRACLDRHVRCMVCQPQELGAALVQMGPSLVITDSQAFGLVRACVDAARRADVRLTSFSVLFARQKGDLATFVQGLKAVSRLREEDVVLIAEGCTHHRQCNDIGAVKIPKALAKLSGHAVTCTFVSGSSFDVSGEARPALVVQCGGCMLTRRMMLNRLAQCRETGVPIVNYGLLLAAAAGIPVAEICV